MNRHFKIVGLLALCAQAFTAVAGAADFDAQLLAIQQDWAVANYQLDDKDAQLQAFDVLAQQADDFVASHPERAEALIWQGIVYSTFAGAKGGLGALGLAKRSRASLEAALAIDAQALNGSAYTSLGTLYHKVPGFPIGFGSDKKAQQMLEQAVSINPAGIDPNYFLGEFLFDEGDYAAAMERLEQALAAPPRPGRELADHGRREEISMLIAKVRNKLNRA